MSLIDLQNVSKTYYVGKQSQLVLNDISFSIESGEFISIMGASGSGKSTLMNIIGLLDKPSLGKYVLKGHDVANIHDDELARIRNHTIGFVFQSFFLLPRLTALQNVALPLLYSGSKVQNAQAHCMSLLEKVGVARWANNRPTALSGGQQQRVAIARSLVANPSILLADEPTGALDTKTGHEVMELFTQLNSEDKVTIIIITHDAKIAHACKRTVHVQDGKIVHNAELHSE